MQTLDKQLRKLEFKWREQASPSDLKGLASERRFHRLATAILHQGGLPWILRIKEADRVENYLGKTDFKLEAVAELGHENAIFWIPIQIKSSQTGAKAFRASNPGTSVRVVVMDRRMTVKRLHQTLDHLYLSEIEHRYHPAPAKA